MRVLRMFAVMVRAVVQTTLGRLQHGPTRATWPFAFEIVLRFMRLDWERTADWSYPRLRDDMNTRPFPRKFAKRATMRRDELGGVPVCVWEPPERRGDDVVLYFHGGSYIYGSSATTHAELLARLAVESGLEVVGLEYRLAPEHPYPAALDDALAAWDALVRRTPPERIVMGGDSAGGNLAVVATLALRDREGPLPRALLLVSPWTDLEMPTASYRDNDPYDFGTREVLVRQAAAFAGSVPPGDARISPIHAKLEGLPPVFVSRGDCELLRDDVAAFTRALEKAGVLVTEHVAPDMPHNAPFFADLHPAGLACFEAMVAFVSGPRSFRFKASASG